jgi:flagellar FliJ protein
MSRFHFRLNSLLKLRVHTREARQGELAAGLRRLRLVEHTRGEVQDELGELETHMRTSKRGSTIDVDRLLDGHRYQLALASRVAELTKAIGEAQQEVERCRLKLVEADRDVKVLEKLHEQQLDEHRRSLAHHETKQLDETALVQALRKAQ